MTKRNPSFSSDSEDEHFTDIDHFEVRDVTLEFFYKPHTISLLAVSLCLLCIFSLFRDDSNSTDNLPIATFSLFVFFILALSPLVFPNGPFTRPHPALWRIMFGECLWDQLLLDVLLCNGLGIVVGMRLCRFLEMRSYRWESVKHYSTTSDKIKRALLQFTPARWSKSRWLDGAMGPGRVLLIFQLLMIWQLGELNTFFLKRIFRIVPTHYWNWVRLVVLGIIVCPAMRQYYIYTTDSRCKRLGTQAWVFIAITCVEAFVCLKFGWDEIFVHVKWLNVLLWILSQLIASIFCVYFCVWHTKFTINIQQGTPAPMDDVLNNNQAVDHIVNKTFRSAVGFDKSRLRPRHVNGITLS